MKSMGDLETIKKMEETEKKAEPSDKNKPRIFLSGSIRGGRHLIETYMLMCNFAEEAGAELICRHIADPELESLEKEMTEEEIYARDMNLLKESGAVIAEVTVPSTGVGYEICRALTLGIPVLCVHKPEALVSAMLLGNPNPLLQIKAYSKKEMLKQIISEFIESF
jgi:nucleoside 2-deoxyribosyltransferase